MITCAGKCRVLVINDNYRLAPWADALYACDPEWWEHHNGCPAFRGQKWTQSKEAAEKFNLHWIPGSPKPGLSLDPACVHNGMNGGYQALNLAVHFGATRILLLGFDMKRGDDNRRHWFGDHPGAMNKDSPYRAWRDAFDTTPADLKKAGVQVINCSRDTALTCFPRAALEEVL